MEGENTKVLIIETSDKMTYDQLELIDKIVSKMKGVELLRCSPDFYKIRYNIHLYDESEIINEIEKLGIKSKRFEKEKFLKWLLKMIANENTKSFENKRLTCCDLNQN
jgi:hypothetical protein